VNAIPPYSAARAEVVRLPEGETRADELAVEEPLEIRVGGEPVAVTMRTPGHDDELSLGFLRSEGIPAVSAYPAADLAANTIEVLVEGDYDLDRLSRNFYTSSSCGVCGKGALEAVAVEAPRVERDLSVGRHNAMDKVIGWAYGTGRLPLSRELLCVSGRLSFELVQKAAVAGCPIMVAVGAPSTLAVELAQDRGITLCGFVRGGRLNVYSERSRIE
jgi:FdhD protein